MAKHGMAICRVQLENQRRVADLDAIARHQGALKHPSSVTVGSIGGTKVFEVKLMIVVGNAAMNTRKKRIVDLYLRFRQTTNNQRLIAGFKDFLRAIRFLVNERRHT